MSNKRYETVELADLAVDVYVRKSLDWGWVQQLADLIAGGTELPPIKVARVEEKLRLIDGRHRKEAYEINDIKAVKAEIISATDDVELILIAFAENYGGPKPQSREDIYHTMELLLGKGVSKRQMPDLLPLPKDVVVKYLKEVQARLDRAKLQAAISAVTEGGLSVPKAAETHGVDVTQLKGLLYGSTRRKLKKGVAEMKLLLSKTYRSLGQRNANALKKIIEKFDEGDVTERQVRDLFAHIEHLQKTSSRAVTDWRKRFDALVETRKSSAA